MINKTVLMESIRTGLAEASGNATGLEWVRDLSGGDINRAALVRSGDTNLFLKYRTGTPPGMFATEARALAEISASGRIRVPDAIAWGDDGTTAWLVLEYIELTANGPPALLGEQLAALHELTKDRFGWSMDNYIGTTPQRNRRSDDWTEFWRQCRLEPQLEMARAAGFGGRLIDRGERLLDCLDELMQDHQPAASLLHGDLWAGNKAYTPAGQPVIFDPASYYGDRETDIAMTELFGGFEPAFYSAYQAYSPLPVGYPVRRELYKLYHMLNHLNLFGAAYLSRCESMLDALLAQVE
ncbi:MAG: fructosamine kinase family protein [Lysobacterales bacterium]